jgi:hypothetical protein
LKISNSQGDHNTTVKFAKITAASSSPFETFEQRAQASTTWFQASVHFNYKGEPNDIQE